MRITIDFTESASDELERIKGLTGLSTADVFRSAFSVFRIVVDEQRQKRAIHLSDGRSLELPFEVKSDG
tara:strand:+ start:490 stop:696 length:207 start_codon:yes stop_codon:yes gene_type:complete